MIYHFDAIYRLYCMVCHREVKPDSIEDVPFYHDRHVLSEEHARNQMADTIRIENAKLAILMDALEGGPICRTGDVAVPRARRPWWRALWPW